MAIVSVNSLCLSFLVASSPSQYKQGQKQKGGNPHYVPPCSFTIRNQILNKQNNLNNRGREVGRGEGRQERGREKIIKVLNKAMYEKETNNELEEEQQKVAGRRKVTVKTGNYISGGL